ncbi:MAG: hypothetical protein QOJ40_2950 [Verrucomicrobiota bacterium]
MTKLPKFFLAISLAAFAVGAVVCFGNLSVHPSWAVAFPAGAIFFGLFLNAYMLQVEVARFDEEEAKKRQLAMIGRANRTTRQEGNLLSSRVGRGLALAHWHSH